VRDPRKNPIPGDVVAQSGIKDGLTRNYLVLGTGQFGSADPYVVWVEVRPRKQESRSGPELHPKWSVGKETRYWPASYWREMMSDADVLEVA